jgi:hypothetical protein
MLTAYHGVRHRHHGHHRHRRHGMSAATGV